MAIGTADYPAQISWHPALIKTANTSKIGTGDAAEVFRAAKDAYVNKLLWVPAGTNVDSVGRVFINNGRDSNQPQNNSPIAEVDLPATTLAEDGPMNIVTQTLGIIVPAGYVLLVAIGTTVSAGYYVTALGGDYQDPDP